MANLFNGANNSWHLDTVYAGNEDPTQVIVPAFPHACYVKSIFLDGTAAGNSVVFENFGNTDIAFQGTATSANGDLFIIEDWWHEGWKLKTLSAGYVEINCD